MRDRAEQQHASAHQFGDAPPHLVDGHDQGSNLRRARGLHQRPRSVSGEFAQRFAKRPQRTRLAGDGDHGGHADQRAKHADAKPGRPAEQPPADRAERLEHQIVAASQGDREVQRALHASPIIP